MSNNYDGKDDNYEYSPREAYSIVINKSINKGGQ